MLNIKREFNRVDLLVNNNYLNILIYNKLLSILTYHIRLSEDLSFHLYSYYIIEFNKIYIL